MSRVWNQIRVHILFIYRKSSLKIFVLNILFSPLLLCMAAVAAALSTSVLPLFTLPIFTLAFPRPSKFWPSTKKSSTFCFCIYLLVWIPFLYFRSAKFDERGKCDLWPHVSRRKEQNCQGWKLWSLRAFYIRMYKSAVLFTALPTAYHVCSG